MGVSSNQLADRQVLIQRFIVALLENGGHISRSCQVVGINPVTILQWKVKDPDFSRLFNNAKELSTYIIEDEIIERALHGVLVPVYHQGKVVGTKVEKSDALLMFLIKARKPEEYGDKTKVVIQSDNSKDITDVLSQAITDTDAVKYSPAIDGMNTITHANTIDDPLASLSNTPSRKQVSTQDHPVNTQTVVSARQSTARKRKI